MYFQKLLRQLEETGEIFSSSHPDNSSWQQADPKLCQHPPRIFWDPEFFPAWPREQNWLWHHSFPSTTLFPGGTAASYFVFIPTPALSCGYTESVFPRGAMSLTSRELNYSKADPPILSEHVFSRLAHSH